MRAVIFDLWDTLALWPSDAFEQTKRLMSRHIGDFDEVWATTYHERQAGPIDAYFRGLGLDDDAVAECLRLRTGFTRDALLQLLALGDGPVDERVPEVEDHRAHSRSTSQATWTSSSCVPALPIASRITLRPARRVVAT